MLKTDGWWDAIGTLKSEHRSQIEQLANIPEQEYKLNVEGQSQPPPADEVLNAFKSVLPTIEGLVRRVTPSPTKAKQCFAAERHDIEECFQNGIVPSRIFAGRPLSLALPVAVLNAAFCFYLGDGLPNLINALADQDASNLRDRCHWTKRLEMWTVKAIEDFFLLEGAQRYGRSATGRVAISAASSSGQPA